MTDRLARAHDRLRRIPAAYERGLRALVTVAPSSARYDGSHGSGPRSRTPAGRDVELRTALVRALRALADAHAELRGTVAAPWLPLRLGSRSGPAEVDTWQSTEGVGIRLMGRIAWTDDGGLERTEDGTWNPPDDSDTLALEHLDTVRSACGLLGARLNDPAPDDEQRFHACRMIDRAVGVLKAAGVWEWPDGARHVSERCANFPACPGWRASDRTECWACVKRAYRYRRRDRKRHGRDPALTSAAKRGQ